MEGDNINLKLNRKRWQWELREEFWTQNNSNYGPHYSVELKILWAPHVTQNDIVRVLLNVVLFFPTNILHIYFLYIYTYIFSHSLSLSHSHTSSHYLIIQGLLRLFWSNFWPLSLITYWRRLNGIITLLLFRQPLSLQYMQLFRKLKMPKKWPDTYFRCPNLWSGT